jgi:fucose 4-O-acetylase-like acetyltransferase
MQRRLDLDRAKGVAILLVVFGHIVARADPAGVLWYEPLRRAVYAFHMPFFLYLSGMVAALSGGLLCPASAIPALLKSRARRLLLPFFGLGLLIVAGKCVAGRFIFVDNAPAGWWSGCASLVWHTADSPALSIWYLFVLFVASLACPLLLRGNAARLPALLAGAALLYVLPMPAYVYLDHIGRYMIFFLAGAYAGLADARWTTFLDRNWTWALAILLLALQFILLCGATWPPLFTLLPVGLISMPAIHGLVRNVAPICGAVFLWFGRYSFMIYLFNTMFIGLAKGVLLQVADWNGSHFLPFAAALMLSGVFGPVALKHYVFARIKPLDRLTN